MFRPSSSTGITALFLYLPILSWMLYPGSYHCFYLPGKSLQQAQETPRGWDPAVSEWRPRFLSLRKLWLRSQPLGKGLQTTDSVPASPHPLHPNTIERDHGPGHRCSFTLREQLRIQTRNFLVEPAGNLALICNGNYNRHSSSNCTTL